MIVFNPADPFPLVDLIDVSPATLAAHSARVDQWLGFRLEAVERRLSLLGSRRKASGASGERQELWFGLETQLLMTPYVEIRALLEELQVRRDHHVVDLGAAYGRMAFILRAHFPQVRFTGYEYVGERVDEGRRVMAAHGLALAALEHRDLAALDFTPCEAEFYFLYDFGTPKAIEKVLYDLRKIARSRPVTIIGRGRHCRSLIASRHPWLLPRTRQGERRFTIYENSEASSYLRCMTA